MKAGLVMNTASTKKAGAAPCPANLPTGLECDVWLSMQSIAGVQCQAEIFAAFTQLVA